MAWRIDFTTDSLKQLDKLGHVEAKRIQRYMLEHVGHLDHPREAGQALKGSRLGNLWRYRVGNYRVVCDLRDRVLVVLVLEVGHRRKVYR